jgi:hypothetical protein
VAEDWPQVGWSTAEMVFDKHGEPFDRHGWRAPR